MLDRWARGEVRAVRLRQPTPEIAWVLLTAPHFDGDPRPWWTLVAEQAAGDPRTLLGDVPRDPDHAFVAVTVEETLDHVPLPLDPATFPWTAGRLCLARVAGLQGGVVERHGPAFNIFADPFNEDAASPGDS